MICPSPYANFWGLRPPAAGRFGKVGGAGPERCGSVRSTEARSRPKIKKDSAVVQRFRGFSPKSGNDDARSRGLPSRWRRCSGESDSVRPSKHGTGRTKTAAGINGNGGRTETTAAGTNGRANGNGSREPCGSRVKSEAKPGETKSKPENGGEQRRAARISGAEPGGYTTTGCADTRPPKTRHDPTTYRAQE